MTSAVAAQTSDLDIHLRKLRRRGIQISPDRAVRVYSLVAQLIVEGTYPSNKKELGLWLTPLLASDAVSQRKIHDYFEGSPKTRREPIQIPGTGGGQVPEKHPRILAITGFFVSAIVAAFIFLLTNQSDTINPNASVVGDIQTNLNNTATSQQTGTPSGTGPGVIDPILTFLTGSLLEYIGKLGYFRLLASILVGSGLAAVVFLRSQPYEKRNRVLDSQAQETSGIAAALGAAAASTQSGGDHGAVQRRSFAGYRRRYALESNPLTTNRLRLRREINGHKFDERATVHKAEKAYGRIVELVPRKRSLSISLLLLIDRHGRSDHMGALGDLMAERLLDNDVAFEAFEYRGDATTLLPRGLRHETDVQSSRHLIELLQETQIGPAIIVSDGTSLVDPITGGLRHWIETLNTARPTILFTPKKPADWGRREKLLIQAGIRLYPTHGSGMEDFTQDLVDFYESEVTPTELYTNPRVRPWSVPERYVYGEDPGQEKREALMFELSSRLSRPAFKLLCALGMAPMVGPDLTLFLGHYARLDAGRAGWIDDAVLSELAQLPWLREGYLPKWLRKELVLHIGKKNFMDAKAAIRAFYDQHSSHKTAQSDGQTVDVLSEGGSGGGGSSGGVAGETSGTGGARAKAPRRRDVLFETIMRAEDMDALMTLLSDDPETLAQEEQRKRRHEMLRRFSISGALICGTLAIYALWPLILTFSSVIGALISRIVDPSNYNTLLYIHHGLLLGSMLALIAGIQLSKLYDEIGARQMQGIKNRRKLGKQLHMGALGVLGLLATADISILYAFTNRFVDEVAAHSAQSVLACLIIGLIFLRPSRAPVTWEDVSKAQNLPFYFLGAFTTAIAIANLIFIVPNDGVVDWLFSYQVNFNNSSSWVPESNGAIVSSSYFVWFFTMIGVSIGMMRITSLEDPGPFSQRRFGQLLTARDIVPVWLSVAVVLSAGIDVLPFSLTLTKGYSSTISYVEQTLSVGPFIFIGFWALHSTRIGPVSAFLPAVVLIGARLLEQQVYTNDAIAFYLIAMPSSLVLGICLVARSANLRGANASLVMLSLAAILSMIGITLIVVLVASWWPELFGSGPADGNGELGLDPQAVFGSVLPFATFIAWLGFMHASARLSVVTEWRKGRGFGYVWLLPLAGCLVSFQVAENLSLTLTDVLLPLAAIAGARGGFSGFLCVVLVGTLGAISFSFGLMTIGGIGVGNGIAAILIAAMFAHKSWTLQWLGGTPPNHAVWAMILAASVMSQSFYFGDFMISIYLYPALCVAGLLIGLGRENVMLHVVYALFFGCLGIVLQLSGIFADFGVFSLRTAFHIEEGVGVALCILLGRAFRVLAFGDVRQRGSGNGFDFVFSCARFISKRPMCVFVVYAVFAYGNPGFELTFLDSGYLKLATPFVLVFIAILAGFQNSKGRDFERSLIVAAISLTCMIVAGQVRGSFGLLLGLGFAPIDGIYPDLVIAPALAFWVGFRLRVETYALRTVVAAPAILPENAKVVKFRMVS